MFLDSGFGEYLLVIETCLTDSSNDLGFNLELSFSSSSKGLGSFGFLNGVCAIPSGIRCRP